MRPGPWLVLVPTSWRDASLRPIGACLLLCRLVGGICWPFEFGAVDPHPVQNDSKLRATANFDCSLGALQPCPGNPGQFTLTLVCVAADCVGDIRHYSACLQHQAFHMPRKAVSS